MFEGPPLGGPGRQLGANGRRLWEGGSVLIDRLQIVDPAKGLRRASGPMGFAAVFRAEPEQVLEFLPEGGGAAFLESEDAGPVLARPNPKDSAADREAITPQCTSGSGVNWVLRFCARRSKALSSQAVRTVPLAEAKQAGAIPREGKTALQPSGLAHFIAEEPAPPIGAPLGKGSRTDLAPAMAHRPVPRQRVLLGWSQTVDILQDLRFRIAPLKLQLAAAGQLQAKQEHSPPAQKADIAGDHGLKARGGHSLERLVEARPAGAGGWDEGAARGEDLPAVRRGSVTRVWTRARASWERCWVRFLRRRWS